MYFPHKRGMAALGVDDVQLAARSRHTNVELPSSLSNPTSSLSFVVIRDDIVVHGKHDDRIPLSALRAVECAHI